MTDVDIYSWVPCSMQEEFADELLKEMRDKISKSNLGFGVTLTGNRLTLRWSDGTNLGLTEVHMIIANISSDRIPEEFEEDK